MANVGAAGANTRRQHPRRALRQAGPGHGQGRGDAGCVPQPDAGARAHPVGSSGAGDAGAGHGDPVRRHRAAGARARCRASTPTLTSETGQRANIRQVTIILSLGIAQANSGLNTRHRGRPTARTGRVGQRRPTSSRTGDALAANEGLVIICQRRNADDIECLAPPRARGACGRNLWILWTSRPRAPQLYPQTRASRRTPRWWARPRRPTARRSRPVGPRGSPARRRHHGDPQQHAAVYGLQRGRRDAVRRRSAAARLRPAAARRTTSRSAW